MNLEFKAKVDAAVAEILRRDYGCLTLEAQKRKYVELSEEENPAMDRARFARLMSQTQLGQEALARLHAARGEEL